MLYGARFAMGAFMDGSLVWKGDYFREIFNFVCVIKKNYFCSIISMSNLRNKSDFNLEAADVLIKNNLFAPSVHCAYYSCFQLFKYSIKSFLGKDYETQATEISLSNPKQNTHIYVINILTKEITKLSESRKLKRDIMDLRQFRIESDYDNIQIDSEKGYKALDKAKEIRRYILQNLH